ncbi:unnamed protein product [Didymodactylos carnosus]|uniref:Uncharacterized protein n=1 Tax=Didymodactylos carnosus TaxID=1234261 RepID=A0A813PE39_9BILA|nr:unnamed protein product [Didymodactylos carnosus]CAF0937989.1 unnamed protein product [Didymodactylos carnosus]CAF3529176.1 unnamed protein product [Didymodactylos carnosus]CAF3713512.1 unnamed protein product [Didymodactylos carnosus]
MLNGDGHLHLDKLKSKLKQDESYSCKRSLSATKMDFDEIFEETSSFRHHQKRLSEADLMLLRLVTSYNDNEIYKLHQIFALHVPEGKLNENAFTNVIALMIDFVELVLTLYTCLDATPVEKISFLFDVVDVVKKHKGLNISEMIILLKLFNYNSNISSDKLRLMAEKCFQKFKLNIKTGRLTKLQAVESVLGEEVLQQYYELLEADSGDERINFKF